MFIPPFLQLQDVETTLDQAPVFLGLNRCWTWGIFSPDSEARSQLLKEFLKAARATPETSVISVARSGCPTPEFDDATFESERLTIDQLFRCPITGCNEIQQELLQDQYFSFLSIALYALVLDLNPHPQFEWMTVTGIFRTLLNQRTYTGIVDFTSAFDPRSLTDTITAGLTNSLMGTRPCKYDRTCLSEYSNFPFP